jgi:hypothetical protein
MTGGWKNDPDGKPCPFQVGLFTTTPFRGAAAYATIGLSNHLLRSRTTHKELRLEAVVMLRDDGQERGVPVVALQSIGRELLASHDAILRGDVVQPGVPVWASSELVAFYASAPAYFADDFAVCDLDSGAQCAIVWLVPVTRSEMIFVSSRGWEAFEGALAAQDPDLLNKARKGMQLAP